MHLIEHKDILELLKFNPYPGRGILLGNSLDGQRTVCAYFIMGRSETSRNRVFVRQGSEIAIRPYLASGPAGSDLTIYRPIKQLKSQLVVSNGDQTETIFSALADGGSFIEALRRRRFEPDAPHFTPRISGLMDLASGAYSLSILKAADELGESCQRHFFEYDARPGEAHFIHTYMGDGNPLPSFQGEPRMVFLAEELSVYARQLWEGLNPQHRVSLFLRETDRQSGFTRSYLFNRHPGQGEE